MLGSAIPELEATILSDDMNPGDDSSSSYIELLGNANNMDRIKAEVLKLRTIHKPDFYVVGIRTKLYSFTGATRLVQILVYIQ